MPRIAIIDLGTNTFHLMVAELAENGTFSVLFKERRYIKLAEGGIDSISPEAFARGIDAMRHFKGVIQGFQVHQIKALGTAALRTAKNGQDFVQQTKSETGIVIDLIDGDKEAELIYHGVMQAIPATSDTFLIMDIGGGSVEFIIADKHEVFWAQSFPLGVAVLYKNFHHSDPIAPEEIGALQNFLKQQLQPLIRQLKERPVSIIVGASGTFDVLGDLFHVTQTENFAEMPVDQFAPFYQRVVKMNIAARLAAEEIPNSRADMIVVALILIDTILNFNPFKKIWISRYALKEGVVAALQLKIMNE